MNISFSNQNITFGRKHKGPHNNHIKEQKELQKQFELQIEDFNNRAVRTNMQEFDYYQALKYLQDQKNQELALKDIFG